MPQQEVYFEQKTGNRRIVVLKTYDQNYAREAFDNMDEDAQADLRKALGIDDLYEAAEIPDIHSLDGAEFMWDELLECAREEGNLLSFFVVNEQKGMASESLYVAPDWPSAEGFAKMRSMGSSSE
jgi:hypothetical protein